MQLIYITRSFCPDRCPTSEQTTFTTAATAGAGASSSSNSNGGSGGSAGGNASGGNDEFNKKAPAVVAVKKLHAKDKVLSITDGCIEDMVSELVIEW